MRAAEVCATVIAQMGPLLRGLEISQEVPEALRLPEGRFAEWAAILQNVLINAANATLDANPPRVRVDGHTGRRVHEQIGKKLILAR